MPDVKGRRYAGLRLECDLTSDFVELANILCTFTAPEENLLAFADRLIGYSQGSPRGVMASWDRAAEKRQRGRGIPGGAPAPPPPHQPLTL